MATRALLRETPIVTGAARGAATARAFAAGGATLILNDILKDQFETWAASLDGEQQCVADGISEPADAMAAGALTGTGRIDVPVNNAGTMFCRDN